jgi:hypothetical protein
MKYNFKFRPLFCAFTEKPPEIQPLVCSAKFFFFDLNESILKLIFARRKVMYFQKFYGQQKIANPQIATFADGKLI